MALQDRYAQISIKKLLAGLAHTDPAKSLTNEADAAHWSYRPEDIWIQSINSTPATAVSDGVAVQVTLDLELDVTSNGHSYKCKLPSGYSGPLGSPGDIITKIIGTKFGSGYEPVLVDENTDTVPLLDPREWYVDSGKVYQEATGGTALATLQCYVYTGQTLKDYLSPVHASVSDGASVVLNAARKPESFFKWSCATTAVALDIDNEVTDGSISFINVAFTKSTASDIVITIENGAHEDTDTIQNNVIGDATYDSGAHTLTLSGDNNSEWEIAVKCWKDGSTHRRVYTVVKLQ